MRVGEIIPYGSVFIDAQLSDLYQAIKNCLTVKNSNDVRNDLINELTRVFTTSQNHNYVLPCLCVRSGFDLFLQVKNFPVGSEILMSAINIPDMSKIIINHRLHIVPLDISPTTLSVDAQKIEQLITERSVAILVAHIYGKWIDVEPLLTVAKKHGLFFIEDCAEAFCGFSNLGHPDSDLSMFSYGIIKVCTCFSGGIVKVKDKSLYNEMLQLQSKFAVQSHLEYMKKLFKYVLCFIILNCSSVTKRGMWLTRFMRIDHQKYAVQFMRGYPNEILHYIRKQPSAALLATMLQRLKNFNVEDYQLGQEKMRYMASRLPLEIKCVGLEASVNNFWLFPIYVENPDDITKTLLKMGIDAYKGCTQLDLIWLPEYKTFEANGETLVDCNITKSEEPLISVPFPHQAKDLIDHVIYLPVHKLVSYEYLDKMCLMLYVAVAKHKLDTFSTEKQRPCISKL